MENVSDELDRHPLSLRHALQPVSFHKQAAENLKNDQLLTSSGFQHELQRRLDLVFRRFQELLLEKHRVLHQHRLQPSQVLNSKQIERL